YAGEAFAHLFTANVALASRLRSRARLKDAVLCHEGHEVIDVVAIPAIRERFQVLDGDRHRVLRAQLTSRSSNSESREGFGQIMDLQVRPLNRGSTDAKI